MAFNVTFNNISDIVAVSFIGGGNRSTGRKSSTCCKSLRNFITQFVVITPYVNDHLLFCLKWQEIGLYLN